MGGAFWQDGTKILEGGLTQGYTFMVVMMFFTVATGGLMVAVVLKYADNILRQFSTALSIIITSLLSPLVDDAFNFDLMFIVGVSLTIHATFMYNGVVKAPCR